MGNREDLDALLCSTINSDHVYFQPPENLQMQYPCVVYSATGNYEQHANNNTYHRRREYELIYITYDPDDEMIDIIADLSFCRMGRPYTADNLHHYPYTMYF